MEFHHIGCAVRSIADSLNAYRDTMGFTVVTDPIYIQEQLVNICFITIGDGSLLELVEPAVPESPISKLLDKKTNYYHVGYISQDFDDEIGSLRDGGFLHTKSFHSEAFGGRRCAFLFSPELHLVELIEAP